MPLKVCFAYSTKSMASLSRNQPCPCGSGKKYKHCCAGRAQSKADASPAVIRVDGSAVSPDQAIGLALQHHQAGRIRKAEAIYEQLLQIQPNHADVLHLIGLASHQQGRHEQAHALISRAVAINPSAAPFHNNLGEVCRSLNRLDEALACYEKALSLQPAFPEALRNIGLTRLAQGQSEQAVSILRETLAKFPEYLGSYWALGLALMNQHKADEALDVYTQGLERSPTDPALLCAKGVALKASGSPEQVIQYYRQAISLQPRVPELHHNLAIILQQLGDAEGAIVCLKNELLLRPGDESARHLLAALQQTTTERAPASYVRDIFDGYAENFDRHLVDKLGYHTPVLLAEILLGTLGPGAHALNILDLGCGTGLFGEQVKHVKKTLAGIDLAPKMIAKARDRAIYDELVVGDLLDYLVQAEPGRFDLMAAVDVFIYVGNLLPVFREASRILQPGGWLAFSLEAAPPEVADFVLDKTGRYQHSRDYVTRLSKQFGFAESAFAPVCLRKEHDKPVEGYLYILSKIRQST